MCGKDWADLQVKNKLDMNQTLSENEIYDETPEYEALGIPEE